MMDKDKNAQLSFEEFQEGSKKGEQCSMMRRESIRLADCFFACRSHHRAGTLSLRRPRIGCQASFPCLGHALVTDCHSVISLK